ncbi:MAG: hypothetical protein WCT04_07535 [Planctomycetota bacterium]
MHFKKIGAVLLALATALTFTVQAGEPTPAPAPSPTDDKIKALLDTEAANQAKLQKEIEAEVENHYQVGKRMYDSFDYEAAKKELELAVKLDRTNEKVRALLQQVRDKFGVRSERIRGAMQNVAEYRQVEIQARMVELDNRLDRGRRYIQQSKDESNLGTAEKIMRLENAIKEFEHVREICKFLPADVDTSTQAADATKLISECEKSIKSLRDSIEKTARTEADRAARSEMERRRRENERLLNEALDRARNALDTGRYALAQSQAQKVLELDPGNVDANKILVATRDLAFDARDKKIKEEYKENFALNREQADRYNIPHSSYLIYPDDWRQIAQRTAQESRRRAEEPWKDEIRNKLKRLVTFEFLDNPLEEAIKFLSSQSKISIILDPKAAGEVGKNPISLNVKDMPLDSALKWVLKLAELEYELRNQAVFITKKADVAAGGELEIYDIRDLTTTVTDFPGPRIDVGTAAAGAAGAGGVDPFAAPPSSGGLLDTDLASLIKEKILQAEFTDPQFTIDVSNGKLVVFQRPEVHDRIRQLLRSFRETQTIQVLTQVRFVDVSDNFLETIGISLTGLDAAPNATQLANAAVDPLNQPSRFGLFGVGGGPGLQQIPSDIQSSPAFQFQNFQATPPYVNRAKGPLPILLLHPRLDANFPNQGNSSVGPALAPVGVRRQWFSKILNSPVLFQGLTQNILPANPLSSVLGQSVQSNPQQGALFQFRFLQSLQTSAVLQAVRKDQTSDQLLAPKLMQFNNQRAHVMVAQQRSYIKDYDVSGAVFDPVISSFLTGVVLEVKPTVSNDKKYITLELKPGTAVELTPPLIVFITNGGNISAGGGSINLPIELPNLELRSINTTVTIPDNGTMLFSGLINDRKIDTKTGVPMLSDLPVVGRFFSTNNKERVRRNLLVLVNSRIILFDEEEANISEKSSPLAKYPRPEEPKIEKCRSCNTCSTPFKTSR